MRLGIATVAVTALAALAAAGVGSAATPVTVSMLGCYFDGGSATVPAGSDVTIRLGWGQQNVGLVHDFLNNETTTATLDGSPIANASARWGAPIALHPGGLSWWYSPSETLANAGDSMSVTMQISLVNRIPQGRDPDTGKQIFAGPDDSLPADFGCTVTAV